VPSALLAGRHRSPASTSAAGTADLFLHLVDLVYASVGEPSLWPDFLSAFADATGGVSAVFFQQDDQEPRASMRMRSRVDTTFIESFEYHAGAIHPWMHHRPDLHAQGVIAASHGMCPPHVLRRSECFHDWLAPRGVVHALGAIVLKQGSLSSVITSLRSPQAGEPTADEIRFVRRLLPHLQRGAQLHFRLIDLETGRASTAAALEHLSVGVVLVDGGGEVLLENGVAREILAGEDGLQVSERRLRAARPVDSRALDDLIAQAVATSAYPRATGARGPGGAIAIPRPSRLRPLALLVAPLHFGQYRVGTRGAAAAVFVSDPERKAESNEEVLQRLYGLTRAEAELTAHLVAGKNLEEAAEARSIAVGTARAQLKSVFAKTGARRQSELVSVLLTGIGQVVVRA
jgi:DNA-binding CsgD family transcriptional regulator